jgi:hypothetical protein
MPKSHSRKAMNEGYNLPITLVGSNNIEYRLNFLSVLLSESEDKINHIDQSRQTNMNYALLIFAGLFSLGVGSTNIPYIWTLSTIIVILMFIFCLWDRRLHRFSHGWQSSNETYIDMSVKVINDPTITVSFPRYRQDCEKNAKFFGFQTIIFIALVLGGLLSFVIFPMVGK